MTRQKLGENILYLSKGPFPGKNIETFIYDNESIYDLQEAWARNSNDLRDNTVYGLFHNLYHLPENNPNIKYPFRGQFWSKRYIYPGEKTSVIHQVTVNEYRNMKQTVNGIKDHNIFPYSYTITSNYYSNWDSSRNTWNGLKDFGNLPQNMETVELETLGFDSSNISKMMEKYIYAKSGNNSFGLIRYELWEPKIDVCGSEACCTNISCENTNPLTITMSNNYNVLSHYDENEDPNSYFRPAFYSDPKLEAFPAEPTNGALPRGRFQISRQAMTTDGKTLNTGEWIQLTTIPTDADFMLSEFISPNQCPDGYRYLGSFATQFYNHQEKNQNYSWAILCGTNKNVLLAQACPENYFSRGWFETPIQEKSAYDYLGNEVSNKKLHYCVHYNEFNYPKK